mgnify:CR=1 FL=1|tara:strand:- start:2848 stop:5511 length:2664 start_codon:yes stop_codon:yes gene_type:complete
MTVLNRSMFIKPMPVVRRSMGSNQTGEIQNIMRRREDRAPTSSSTQQSFFDKLSQFFNPSTKDEIRKNKLLEEGFTVEEIEKILNAPSTDRFSVEEIEKILNTPSSNNTSTTVSDDSTVYDFGEYGGKYDLKEAGFQRVLMNYLPEGASLFSDPENFILSEEGIGAIEAFRADIEKMRGMNRAEGSPMQGEMAQPKQDVENVGIMDGFNDPAAQKVASDVLQKGESQRKQIAESDDYEELMNAIRGDTASEDDRRDELATIVGDQDAKATPDSVLVLVQPVMEMMSVEDQTSGIGQLDQGRIEMPKEASGIGSNMAVPIQKFNTGNIVETYKDLLPLYQQIAGRFDDPNVTQGQTLLDLSKAGFAVGLGAAPQEGAALFFDQVGKRGTEKEKTKQALDFKLASGALDKAIGLESARISSASKQKEIKTVKGDKSANDVLLAIQQGFFKSEEGEDGQSTTVPDMDAFYEIYGKGSTFEFTGGNITKVNPFKDTKGTNYIVSRNTLNEIEGLPANMANIPNIQEILKDLPEGSTVFLDSNNKITTTLKPVEDKEPYYNTAKKKIEFLSDREFEELTPLEKNNYTIAGEGTTYVKMQKEGEQSIDIPLAEAKKYIQDGWQMVPNSQVNIETDDITGVLGGAKGGEIVKRSDGTPESGEGDADYYEGLIKDAEDLIGSGTFTQAKTETDRSFFNSLYSASYDGLNELLTLKQLIAADPSLMGYTGLFQQSLNKIAGVINDLDNSFGDYVFPDDGSNIAGKAVQYVTKPEIADIKASVEQLSDAVADIMSLRGKRGTPEAVRKRAEDRTKVASFEPQQNVLNRIDKLTDFLIDKTKIFAVLSGNFDSKSFPAFRENIEQLRIKIKDINPTTFSGKKTTYSISELEDILKMVE